MRYAHTSVRMQLVIQILWLANLLPYHNASAFRQRLEHAHRLIRRIGCAVYGYTGYEVTHSLRASETALRSVESNLINLIRQSRRHAHLMRLHSPA